MRWIGFNAAYFNNMTREEKITKPLFTSFNDDRLHTTNLLAFADAELRAKMLGDAIPAESFAAGANATGGLLNYDVQSQIPNGWPRTKGDWRHSDLKDVAYYYVWKLYEKISKGE